MKKWKTIWTTIFASVGIFCATAAMDRSFSIFTAAAEAQGELTSNPIIKTEVLGDIDVSSLKMKDGAAVRMKGTAGEEANRNGLRFTALFNKNIYNKLEELDDAYDTVSVSYGMLIVPYDYHLETPITVESVFGANRSYYIDKKTEKTSDDQKKLGGWCHATLPEEDGDTREKEVYCSIINIAKSQLTRQWIGVAYVEYIENGVRQYYMTEVESENARSMVYVAQRAIQDQEEDKPSDAEKTWLEENYTTYDKDVVIPTKEYTYTVNHILVDPLGNETVKATETKEATALYSSTTDENGKTIYTENRVESTDAQQQYAGYEYDATRSVLTDIVYANHMTALNYYYNEEHCDIAFTGTRCTIQMDDKEGAELSYVSLNGASSFSFRIVPDVGYSSGTVTVTVNGQSVAATNGEYTVSLAGKENGDTITINATVDAGTVSDQVFEGSNYDAQGEQTSAALGWLVGVLGYGGLTVDEEQGTITSKGGSLELSGDFIKNALDEGYTHMSCNISMSGGIGTLTKLEMTSKGKSGDAVVYQKVTTDKSRTDRIDLTEFQNADGTCKSLLYNAYRSLFNRESISSSATVVLSNIQMYKSEETTGWKKFKKVNGNSVEITNAYAAYENGNLVIETMEDNTYFETDSGTIAYDLAVGVSMSFAFKYLNVGQNTDSFFYHFTAGDMTKTSSGLSTCHLDESGYYHMCILPETVQEAAKGQDVKFHFGLYKPGAAVIIPSNSGASIHSTFDNGTETIVADTWGYPYGHGIYNEFLTVKSAEYAKQGVQFNLNMRGNHTIHLTVTADFNFEGFWYGNNEWSGYKAGMNQFHGVDKIEQGDKTYYWTEIKYSSKYTEKGFNIHWRDDTDGDGSAYVGTMQLRYTLTKDAATEYYTFSPNKHMAGVEASEELQDNVKVERLTGVEGATFTMPVLYSEEEYEAKEEKTISITVSAAWNFSCLQYGTGSELKYFAPNQDTTSKLYTETVTVTAFFVDGFKIYYKDTFPVEVAKGTIDVRVNVQNFETTSEGVKLTEVLQTGGWTKLEATNVQRDTVLSFPAVKQNECLGVMITTNIPLAGKLSYGAGNLLVTVREEMVKEQSASGSEEPVYVAQFSYCDPDVAGFLLQLLYEENDAAFPANAWMRVQYRFTDFKIKNTENVEYTGVQEKTTGRNQASATLYSGSDNARFWLDTKGFSEIRGTISTKTNTFEKGSLLYGHGWDTPGVIAIDPASGIFNEETQTYQYSFVYHDSLQSGFCIYYAEGFSGTVVVDYALTAIHNLSIKQEYWSVEDGGSLTFKENGMIEYASPIVGEQGKDVHISASLLEIAVKNGYASVGISLGSNNVFTAQLCDAAGNVLKEVRFAKENLLEHSVFNVSISKLYEKDENGAPTGKLNDLILRFVNAEGDQIDVSIENVVFIAA